MASCDNLIKMSIKRDCTDPLAMGYEKMGILINREHINFGSVEYGETNNLISFDLSYTGEADGNYPAYWVYQNGSKPFNGTNKTVEVSETLGASVTSNVRIVLPDHSPAILDGVVDPILNGEFVFISFNKHKGLNSGKGKSAFEVHGFYNGLTISEGSRDAYSEETGGGWAFTLTETRAPKAGLFFFKVDYDTTLNILKGFVEGVEDGE